MTLDKSIICIKYKPTVYKSKLKPLCIAAITVFLLLMLEPTAVISSMHRSLRLCAGTVIPALFPYLVASELLVRSGAGERLATLFSLPVRAVFGVSDVGAVVYVMGVLCGFPVAARTAASYVKAGKLSTGEAEHLLCFCNVPSAAFVINAVGVSLYKEASFGRLLWVLALLSAAVVGVSYRLLFPTSCASCGIAVTATAQEVQDPKEDGSFSEAVRSAAGGMLSVVATVLFFGAVLGALNALLSHFFDVYAAKTSTASIWITTLVSCLFEMTGGVASAAELLSSTEQGMYELSCLLCAAAVGWGGLSVQFQLLSANDGISPPLRTGRFFVSRLIQCALCVLGTAIWLGLQ